MRLRRSVLAGLVAGVVAGFLVALLRPRSTHPAAVGYPVPSLPPGPAADPAADLPSIAPAVAPGDAVWEQAGSVPGASRLTRSTPTHSSRTTD